MFAIGNEHLLRMTISDVKTQHTNWAGDPQDASWVLVPGEMKEVHSMLSLPPNAAVQPAQNAWSSYLRMLKSNT